MLPYGDNGGEGVKVSVSIMRCSQLLWLIRYGLLWPHLTSYGWSMCDLFQWSPHILRSTDKPSGCLHRFSLVDTKSVPLTSSAPPWGWVFPDRLALASLRWSRDLDSTYWAWDTG